MILVDTARWPWRGRLWAHLVSDTSVEELHAFAHHIGKRRVGFQGDHYDVDTVERQLAIDRGANPVDSRALVQRLRDSGLRVRGGLPKWEVTHDGPAAAPVHALTRQLFAGAGRVGQELASAVALIPDPDPSHLVLLSRNHEAAALVRTIVDARPLVAALETLVSEVWVHKELTTTVIELLHREPG